MNELRRSLLAVAAAGMLTAAASAAAQTPPIDAAAWMVGEWTGSSQAGVAFTIGIAATGAVNYVYGGKALATGSAEKSGNAVRFTFTNAPGHYIELVPTGPNSGTWIYVGGNATVSRSTITRRR